MDTSLEQQRADIFALFDKGIISFQQLRDQLLELEGVNPGAWSA